MKDKMKKWVEVIAGAVWDVAGAVSMSVFSFAVFVPRFFFWGGLFMAWFYPEEARWIFDLAASALRGKGHEMLVQFMVFAMGAWFLWMALFMAAQGRFWPFHIRHSAPRKYTRSAGGMASDVNETSKG